MTSTGIPVSLWPSEYFTVCKRILLNELTSNPTDNFLSSTSLTLPSTCETALRDLVSRTCTALGLLLAVKKLFLVFVLNKKIHFKEGLHLWSSRRVCWMYQISNNNSARLPSAHAYCVISSYQSPIKIYSISILFLLIIFVLSISGNFLVKQKNASFHLSLLVFGTGHYFPSLQLSYATSFSTRSSTMDRLTPPTELGREICGRILLAKLLTFWSLLD